MNMNMNKFTSGPWGACPPPSSNKYSIRYITGANAELIADIGQPACMTQDEALANATLIKAAPDMLAALEHAEAFIEDYFRPFLHLNLDAQEAVNHVSKVILKARGKA